MFLQICNFKGFDGGGNRRRDSFQLYQIVWEAKDIEMKG